MALRTSVEGKRGCGYRKIGGTYLMGGKMGAMCGKLPFELTVCPTCHAGVKQTRGWTWIEPQVLFASIIEQTCVLDGTLSCALCPMSKGNVPERAGLLWIGEAYYKMPGDWLSEANRVGVSRRISAVPKDFVLGATIVYVAHSKAVAERCPDCGELPFELRREVTCETCSDTQYISKPGVFASFRPTSIDKVVDAATITDEEVEALEKRGIEAVIVEHKKGEV